MERKDLTPIAGSEATDGRSDDGQVLEETEDMPAEQKRELERRRLSLEEKRVANAAADYRKRLAERDAGGLPKSNSGISRARTIQSKVQILLDNDTKPPPIKSAEGYDPYTENKSSSQARIYDVPPGNPYTKPPIARKPVTSHSTSLPNPKAVPASDINYAKTRQPVPSNPGPASPALVHRTAGRPSAPPKPMHLNSISTGPQSSTASRSALQAHPDMTAAQRDDYIADFSKRFPSLSGIEMVETAIQSKEPTNIRTKEV